MNITKHAKGRMSLRVITLQDIYNCVKSGILSTTKENHKKYTNEFISVILDNDTNTVITCFYISKIDKQIKKIAYKNKISKRQATKILRGELTC